MSPRRHARQGGEGNLGCVFWTAALLIAVTIAWKAVPVKMATSQLEDYMIEQAKFAVRTGPEAIRTRILNKAKELDLPVTRRDIAVQKSGGRIEMHCSYTIPLEFPFYTYMWDVDHSIERGIFQF